MFVTLIKPLARLHPRAWDFVQLVRLDRPIGIYLLLWPTLWSLWIAADGVPELKNLLIFVLGVILMRAAGCVINDFADRNFDGHVARTKARPLATGKISVREAWITFAVLVALSFGLVLLTNATTVWLSFGAVAVASLYPFMKRYTYYPQVVLGAAYSWGILMAFTAERGELPASAWLLFLANVLWTVAYDSYYAMTDREDDLKIGIKSTAILFGDADRLIIGSLQGPDLGEIQRSLNQALEGYDCQCRMHYDGTVSINVAAREHDETFTFVGIQPGELDNPTRLHLFAESLRRDLALLEPWLGKHAA